MNRVDMTRVDVVALNTNVVLRLSSVGGGLDWMAGQSDGQIGH